VVPPPRQGLHQDLLLLQVLLSVLLVKDELCLSPFVHCRELTNLLFSVPFLCSSPQHPRCLRPFLRSLGAHWPPMCPFRQRLEVRSRIRQAAFDFMAPFFHFFHFFSFFLSGQLAFFCFCLQSLVVKKAFEAQSEFLATASKSSGESSLSLPLFLSLLCCLRPSQLTWESFLQSLTLKPFSSCSSQLPRI